MITRRTFLVARITGGVTLTAVYWLYGKRHGASIAMSPTQLDPDAASIVTAIVPVLLDNALPQDAGERKSAIDETVTNVARAISGLPPSAQQELAELFSLLAFAPTRVAIARIASPWASVHPADIAAFLDRWRTSDWTLLRSAYGALHQLVYAAWYGNPRAWTRIGYDGPPALTP